MLVLNRDFPPMMTLWGQWPLYKQFSSAINSNNGRNGETKWTWADGRRMPYPENEHGYYRELASNILYYIEHNPVLMEQKMVRQERSIEYVMSHFLEPIINR